MGSVSHSGMMTTNRSKNSKNFLCVVLVLCSMCMEPQLRDYPQQAVTVPTCGLPSL